MSIVESLFGAAKGLVTAIAESKLPHQIVETYPETSQAAGARVGSYLLKRTEKGFEYALVRPPSFGVENAQAELVIDHDFLHLSSLRDYLVVAPVGPGAKSSSDGEYPQAFLRFNDDATATCICLPWPTHPEFGQAELGFDRHPAWHRWARVGTGFAAGQQHVDLGIGFAAGQHVDLSHVQIADLLLDNAEDLDEPMIAKHLSALRAARQVEYDANLNAGGSMGVKTTFGLDRSTETVIPREFTARFPAFTGAWWPTGDELADAAEPNVDPSFQARFRLRVMPPKGDGSTGPIFRLIWTNALDFEHQARLALGARCREVLRDVAQVYLGRPSVHRYILPKGAQR